MLIPRRDVSQCSMPHVEDQWHHQSKIEDEDMKASEHSHLNLGVL